MTALRNAYARVAHAQVERVPQFTEGRKDSAFHTGLHSRRGLIGLRKELVKGARVGRGVGLGAGVEAATKCDGSRDFDSVSGARIHGEIPRGEIPRGEIPRGIRVRAGARNGLIEAFALIHGRIDLSCDKRHHIAAR